MEENKEQIAKLQSMLKNSKTNSSQLKRAVESLTQELNAKTQRIEELQAELASKNIRIQELDAAVTDLNAVKSELTAENEAKAKTVAEQDKALNTAWFVFGTKKELNYQILGNTPEFFRISNLQCQLILIIFFQGIRTGRMGSQNIGIFGIQFDFFGSTNINLGKIILINITIFQDRTFFK